MANPIFQAMGGNMPMNNMVVMMQSFNKFANAFKGNPRETVQGLLNSGRMTQDQYNQLEQMARQFQQMMPR